MAGTRDLNGALLALGIVAVGAAGAALAGRRGSWSEIVESFSYGTTPDEAIRTAWRRMGDDDFDMKLVGDDAEAAEAAFNQGIDSYLEALTDSSGSWAGHRLQIDIGSEKDMLVFLRRLREAWEEGDDASGDLRSSILYVLGIEEI